MCSLSWNTIERAFQFTLKGSAVAAPHPEKVMEVVHHTSMLGIFISTSSSYHGKTQPQQARS